jgi:putative sterol carrier protein
MGGEVTLLGFTLYKSDHYQTIKKLAFQLTKSLDKIEMQGLYLGMSRKKFNDFFKGEINSAEPFATPEITMESKSTLLVFDGKEKLFDKEEKKMMDCDDAITIDAKFDKDGLYFLSVSQLVQN